MKILERTIKQYYIPIIIALVSKIFIIFILSDVFTSMTVGGRSNLSIWELWNVWDAPHYISIASSGYQTLGDESNFIVFLPLFPLLIFISKTIFLTSFLVGGYIVSFFASILLAVMLYKLTLLDFSKETAILTVLLIFIFPTSFFLHIPYTESLFIFLVVSSFYFLRQKQYLISFLFVSLAGFTRLAGLALIPVILLEILFFDKENFIKKNIYRKFAFLLCGLVFSLSGFIVYLLLNHFLYGNFLQFTMAEKQNWYTTFSPFGQGLISAFQSFFWRTGLEKIMLSFGQIVAFIMGLMISVYVVVRIRFSYGLYMLIILWFSYSMSFWLSMPRYILSLFPMFIALALFSKNSLFRFAWISTSIILLIFFALTFIQYGPVF